MRMLGEQSLRLRRFAQGDDDTGDFIDGSSTVTRFRGVIQPLQQREIQQLPEEWRTRARWKLYTRTILRVVDIYEQTSADRVIWTDPILGRDIELLVFSTANYMTTPAGMRLQHYRYFLIEQELDEEE